MNLILFPLEFFVILQLFFLFFFSPYCSCVILSITIYNCIFNYDFFTNDLYPSENIRLSSFGRSQMYLISSSARISLPVLKIQSLTLRCVLFLTGKMTIVS